MDEHERNSQEVPDQEELEAKRLPWESLWTGCGVGDRAGFRGYVSTEEEAFKVKDAYEIWSSLKFNVEAGFAKPQPELQQRVRYSDINDSVVVADGVPFVGNHQQTYCCMFGKDKHAKSKKKGQGENEENLMKDHPVPRKRKYRLVQPSRKKGCTAKIKMKKVVRYPDFKVDVNATHWKKNHISAQIRAALAKGEELNREERIYISLPDDVDHNGHDVGKLTGFVKPIDSRVSSKLTELVGQGVSNLREMRRHLRIYVETVLCPDLKPSPSDTAFYPSDEVLGTRMYAAKMKLRCIKMSVVTTTSAETAWSSSMWDVVQKVSSFIWEGEKKLSYLPFIVNGTQVGIIPPVMVEALVSQPDLFERKDNEIHLSPSLMAYEERTAMVGEFMEKCRQSGSFVTLQGWRNENYAVSKSYYDTPLFEMERSATCLFGIKQYGVHVNGYCRHPTDGLCMWIGKRSPTKQTYPGKLDQIAAGGLPAGMSIRECMMKECDEEASIPRNISSEAISVGAISYFFEDERGLFPETQFIYDLELPPDFQPVVKDGEVSEFYLCPLNKVKEEIATERFKPNCSLICLDFLIRHGYITHDDEPHYLDFLSRIHQTHF